VLQTYILCVHKKYNISVAMRRMKAEKNYCLTETVLGSEQSAYAYLLYYYLRSTTMFRMVGLVSLGFSFRYVIII